MPDRVSDPALVAALREFRDSKGSAVSGALLVSCIVNPDTDPDWCRARFRELAALLPDGASAADVTVMLAAQGFRGARAYYASVNSSLQSVLESGEGIPITLAMVVLGVCEAAEIPAAGLNFPGHFLVSIDDVLVDPYEMVLLDELALQRRLRKLKLKPAQALEHATPAGVVLRMLNNLAAIAVANDDHARALEFSDYKMQVADDLLPLHLERVDLWEALGVPSMARRELSAAIGLVPAGDWRDELQRRLAALDRSPSRLH